MAVLTGLAYPLQLDEEGNLALYEDERLIQSHILSWLQTEPLERLGLPGYGTPDYAFESIQSIQVIAADLEQDLKTNIPQATFNVLGSVNDAGETELEVRYTVSDLEQTPIVISISNDS
ncbi:MAG: hypothetical protein ACFE0I_02520 [Elainellaceae cyanobacterium]